MRKTRRRLHRRLVFVCSAALILLHPLPEARADGMIVPARKPDTQENKFFGLRLLEFMAGHAAQIQVSGGLPVPDRKPAGEAVAEVPAQNNAIARLLNETPPEGQMEPGQAALYKIVFDLQEEGKNEEADKVLSKIRDPRLMGHVLYQRYMHPTAYTTNFWELQNWLDLYADLPGADDIYALAMRKNPGGQKLRKPQLGPSISQLREPTMRPGKMYASAYKRGRAEKQAVQNFSRRIHSLIGDDRLSQAAQEVRDSQILDQVEKDILFGDIAAGFLYMRETEKAYQLAAQSAKRSGAHVPKAAWVAGLVAWKKLNYKQAARYFEVVAVSPYGSGWTAASGGFWAARAHMRLGNVKDVSIWLEYAAKYPRTFYGLLATRSLGRDFDFNWQTPDFTLVHQQILQTTPGGARALMLVEAGREHMAEAELLRMRPRDSEMKEAMLAFAAQANLPGLSLRLGASYDDEDNVFFDAALYPQTPWVPKSGFKVDPALVHAIMRQESRFDPFAESPSGARGLMQLMPATASYIGGSKKWQSKEGKHNLLQPAMNLELGQNYLLDLLGQSYIRGDLLSMLVAYNAGPGNLRRWKKTWQDVDDSLLFIELIPSGETRAYVERVLANYWIYRLREGLPVPSLEALAEGREARYALLDERAHKTKRL